MTGNIFTKKGRANWYAVLNVYDAEGKRKRKWIDAGVAVDSPKHKTRAKARLEEILVEYRQSGVDLTKETLFVDFMVGWLDTMKLSVAPTTYDGYIYAINTHILPYFEPKKLKVAEMTPAVIQKFINDKLSGELSPNTVRKFLFNISKCLDMAVINNLIAVNPVKRIKMPSPIKFTGAKFYNERQIESLLEISKGSPLEIVILLTLFYGLRRSEVLGLKWDAVDFEAKTISIRHTVVVVGNKTHKKDRTKNDASNATFPMSDNIVQQLMEWKRQQDAYKALQPNSYIDEGYVCTNPKGELLRPNFVTQHFAALLRKNELPHIRFHDLRHSSASFLKNLGFDLKDIQVWLRHKDIQTTMNL